MTTSRDADPGETGSDPAPLVSTIAADASTRDLLEAFVRGLPGRFEAIGAALHAGDPRRARELVHRLGGTAGSFGFPAITAVGLRLEGLLARGEEHAAVLAELGGLCRAARAASE